jgi:tetratricopeptide (TPR) repeat protein
VKRGRPAEALSAYEKGLELSPNDPGLHHNLAVLLEKNGRRTEALVHARDAVKADPAYLDARIRLGELLLAECEWSAAMMQFMYVEKARPDDAAALAGLARAYEALGLPDKSARVREALRRTSPAPPAPGTDRP